MVMLAERYAYVIGGDPDRDTIDLAVIDTSTGVVRGHVVGRANAAGYADAVAWADRHAVGPRVWALEGTGNYGAGLASFLADAGEDVVEIDRVKRHRRGGKNDQIDAGPRRAGSVVPADPDQPAAAWPAKRCGSCSPPAMRCWSAEPRRSTSSRP